MHAVDAVGHEGAGPPDGATEGLQGVTLNGGERGESKGSGRIDGQCGLRGEAGVARAGECQAETCGVGCDDNV